MKTTVERERSAEREWSGSGAGCGAEAGAERRARVTETGLSAERLLRRFRSAYLLF